MREAHPSWIPGGTQAYSIILLGASAFSQIRKIWERKFFMLIYSEFHHVLYTIPNTSFCSSFAKGTDPLMVPTNWVGLPPLLPLLPASAANWNKTSYLTTDKTCVRFKGACGTVFTQEGKS